MDHQERFVPDALRRFGRVGQLVLHAAVDVQRSGIVLRHLHSLLPRRDHLGRGRCYLRRQFVRRRNITRRRGHLRRPVVRTRLMSGVRRDAALLLLAHLGGLLVVGVGNRCSRHFLSLFRPVCEDVWLRTTSRREQLTVAGPASCGVAGSVRQRSAQCTTRRRRRELVFGRAMIDWTNFLDVFLGRLRGLVEFREWRLKCRALRYIAWVG